MLHTGIIYLIRIYNRGWQLSLSKCIDLDIKLFLASEVAEIFCGLGQLSQLNLESYNCCMYSCWVVPSTWTAWYHSESTRHCNVHSTSQSVALRAATLPALLWVYISCFVVAPALLLRFSMFLNCILWCICVSQNC